MPQNNDYLARKANSVTFILKNNVNTNTEIILVITKMSFTNFTSPKGQVNMLQVPINDGVTAKLPDMLKQCSAL